MYMYMCVYVYMYHPLFYGLRGIKPTGHKIRVQRVPFSKRFKPSPKQTQQFRYRRVGNWKFDRMKQNCVWFFQTENNFQFFSYLFSVFSIFWSYVMKILLSRSGLPDIDLCIISNILNNFKGIQQSFQYLLFLKKKEKKEEEQVLPVDPKDFSAKRTFVISDLSSARSNLSLPWYLIGCRGDKEDAHCAHAIHPSIIAEC